MWEEWYIEKTYQMASTPDMVKPIMAFLSISDAVLCNVFPGISYKKKNKCS
jgi:hypothetical protein